MNWERLLIAYGIAVGVGIGIFGGDLEQEAARTILIVAIGGAVLVGLLALAFGSLFRSQQVRRAAKGSDQDLEELKAHATRVFRAVAGTLLSEPVPESDVLVSERFRTRLREGTEPVIPPSLLHARLRRIPSQERVHVRRFQPDADPPAYTARVEWGLAIMPGPDAGGGQALVGQDWRFTRSENGTWVVDGVRMLSTVYG